MTTPTRASVKRQTRLAYNLLAFLADGQPHYGLEMAKANPAIRLGGTYQTLIRMAHDGFVTAEHEQLADDMKRPLRHYYRITDQGRQFLASLATKYASGVILDTREQYKEALAELAELCRADPPLNTPEANRINELTEALLEYEGVNFKL